jgi:hypothetical protein
LCDPCAALLGVQTKCGLRSQGRSHRSLDQPTSGSVVTDLLYEVCVSAVNHVARELIMRQAVLEVKLRTHKRVKMSNDTATDQGGEANARASCGAISPATLG